MRRKHRDYSNFRFAELTEEFIHSARDRKMLIDFYVDDVTLDELCEKYHLSMSQVKRIVADGGDTVFKHMGYK